VPWLTGYQNKGEKRNIVEKLPKRVEKLDILSKSYRKYGELLFKSYQKFQF
jgi:hypothetical protein